MKTLTPCIIFAFSFVFLNLVPGCSNNYSSTQLPTETSQFPKLIERAKKNRNTFMMHSGVDTYKVTSIEVEQSKQQFTVQLNKPDAMMGTANSTTSQGAKVTHMYMRDSVSYTLDEPHTIPLSKVARIE